MMAKFVRAWMSRDIVLKKLVEAAKEADAHREEEYAAAVKIQSWFRGVRVRAYLKYLNECAVTIQKNFRAFLGRKAYRQRLKECVKEMHERYYNTMTTRIQSAWKGYYVRKYVFDYTAYKLYMAGLVRTNEIVLAKLQEEREKSDEERLNREETLQEIKMQDEARRHHYMLSTECQDGIFKSKQGVVSNTFEQQMRTVCFSQPTSLKTRRQFSDKRTYPSKNSNTPSKDSSKTSLPPLVQKAKVQGPFRSTGEVRRQRVKPLNPTLRVTTDFNSEEVARAELRAEEWRNRVIDEKFLPFSKTKPSYQSLLHTRSSYEKPLYGTQTFRIEKATSKTQPFRTVVPPIPIFEKLNTTY